MPNRWLVTVDNLHDETFDEFLNVFFLGEDDEADGIGSDYLNMSPATTAILVSSVSSKTILNFVEGRLNPDLGRATVVKLSGTVVKLSGNDKNIGKVWDIDMATDGIWKNS